MQTLTIPTNGPGLYEFTDQARALAKGSGLLTVFIRHTSASLLSRLANGQTAPGARPCIAEIPLAELEAAMARFGAQTETRISDC